MKRRVTKLVRERAFATIKIVAKAMLNGEKAISYSELATRLGMPNQTGQGLGPILDEAAWMCKDNGLPDVTSVVVTKESLEQGRPMPSSRLFDENGYWAITDIFIGDVPDYQSKVQVFDWASKRELGLGQNRLPIGDP